MASFICYFKLLLSLLSLLLNYGIFAAVFYFILIANDSAAAPMHLQHVGDTVSGIKGIVGTVHGEVGISRLTLPYALCFGRTDDEIIIGDSSYFRNLSRRNKTTGHLFGRRAPGTANGRWENATVDSPVGCVRRVVDDKMTVYFVEGSSALRYFTNDSVFTKTLSSGTSFTDIFLFNNTLYMSEQISNTVWMCDINSNGEPDNCNATKMTCKYRKNSGIAVTHEGIFVVGYEVGAAGICWFDKNGSVIADYPGDFVDIHALPSGILYAITENEIYNVTTGVNLLTVTRIVGDQLIVYPECRDGYEPLLCKNKRIFIIAEKELYLATGYFTVRSISLPPVLINGEISVPLPVNFPDKDDIMPKVVTSMEKAVNKALGTNDSLIKENEITVNDETWNTKVPVLVEQQQYDNDSTPINLNKTDFNNTINILQDYYKKTDVGIYLDTNILPFCNEKLMREIEYQLTMDVRKSLNFSHIFSTPLVPNSTGKNSSVLKLLMPPSFNNRTTHKALKKTNFSTTLMKVLYEGYGPDNNVKLVFSSPKYDFSHLTAEGMNALRWLILDTVYNRLKKCENIISEVFKFATNDTKQTTYGNNSDDFGNNTDHGGGDSNFPFDIINEDEFSCNLLITNHSISTITHPPFNELTVYEVFVPTSYKFNVSLCIQGTEWSSLDEYILKKNLEKDESLNDKIKSRQKVSSKQTCDRGCVIGLAIASSTVMTGVIASAVVLRSKRKRLAAVLAPRRPGFKGILNENLNEENDDYEDEIISTNPLNVNSSENVK